MFDNKELVTEEVRILGRNMAEELTSEEIEQVFGGSAISTGLSTENGGQGGCDS